MIEKYFSGYRENELELTVEIKRCLLDFVLKNSGHIFYLVEFHEFTLAPMHVFEFTDFEKYCDFVDQRESTNPRVLIEKGDIFFVEFNGHEIHAGFELVNQEISINIWHVMRLEHAS